MEPWSVYDEMGAQFERHAADGAYNAHYDRPAVLDALGPVEGRHVLDAACGPGLYAEALLARGATVTGFDASEEMLRLARARVGTRAQLGRAVLGEPLPYPDAAFDAAVCALAVHHVAQPAAAFAELLRVVRPGGHLVVSTQHPTADWLRLGGSYFAVELAEDVWHMAEGDRRVRFWRRPLADLCAAATGTGWLIEQLVEPLPTDGMRERLPEDHARLLQAPGFLVLRLVRPVRPPSVTG